MRRAFLFGMSNTNKTALPPRPLSPANALDSAWLRDLAKINRFAVAAHPSTGRVYAIGSMKSLSAATYTAAVVFESDSQA